MPWQEVDVASHFESRIVLSAAWAAPCAFLGGRLKVCGALLNPQTSSDWTLSWMVMLTDANVVIYHKPDGCGWVWVCGCGRGREGSEGLGVKQSYNFVCSIVPSHALRPFQRHGTSNKSRSWRLFVDPQTSSDWMPSLPPRLMPL